MIGFNNLNKLEYTKIEQDIEEYGENALDDVTVDRDCHINSRELPELIDEKSVEDFIANLNDWD